MASGDRIQLARISDIPTKISQLEQDIEDNATFVGLTINAPTQVKGGSTWTVNVDTVSYLNGVTIDHLEVTWWDTTETINVTGTSMVIERVVPAYPAAPVTVSVFAVDSIGNKSKIEAVQATVADNQPPVGPITINHETTINTSNESFDVSLSGATDSDNDVVLTYEIVDNGGLTFSKSTGILAGEIVSVTVPDVAENVDITFSVRATDGITYSSTYSSVITVIAVHIIGVKMVATGGNGGTWAHIDETGAEIVTPTKGWFDAHPVFGGIVDQIIDDQHMVKVPKFYYKRGATPDGKQAWWISNVEVEGFSILPAFVLDGVEVDQFWYGKYQASYSDGKLQSVPGLLPRTNISFTDALVYSTARNINGVVGFRLHHYSMWLAIQWLYLVENGSMDSQTTTGNGHINTSGVTYVDTAQATYRGIVGLWGNVQQWMDGVRIGNYNIERQNYNGVWYISTDNPPRKGYAHYPATFRDNNEEFLADIYKTTTTDSTTPDRVIWTSSSAPRYPVVGGAYNSNTSESGLWAIFCIYSETISTTAMGGRLSRVV